MLWAHGTGPCWAHRHVPDNCPVRPHSVHPYNLAKQLLVTRPMAKDPRTNEVSLRAKITDSSLEVGIRSRTAAALDRLLGGFFGIPAAWLERHEKRIRNQADSESIIRNAAAKRMKAAILNDEEVSEVVAEMALSAGLSSVANKVRVAQLAVEDLAENVAGQDAPADQQEETPDVDVDWLNHFGSHAEKISSERMQLLWAKVLAGEIRQPGAFSLSTLRLLSELDQSMALALQEEVKYRVGNDYILTPGQDDMKGERLGRLSFLEEVGLLQTIDPISGVMRTIAPGRHGKAHIREQYLLLEMEFQATVEFRIILLTRAGREIAGLLPPPDPLAVLERVGDAVKDQVDSMKILRILADLRNGMLRTTPYKTLKQKQEEPPA